MCVKKNALCISVCFKILLLIPSKPELEVGFHDLIKFMIPRGSTVMAFIGANAYEVADESDVALLSVEENALTKVLFSILAHSAVSTGLPFTVYREIRDGSVLHTMFQNFLGSCLSISGRFTW